MSSYYAKEYFRCITIAALFCSALLFLGCARYAQVYAKAVDAKNDTVIDADIYSGIDGRYLGTNPITISLVRQNDEAVELVFVVDAYRGCYRAAVYRVEVSRWAKSEASAAQPSYTNNYKIPVLLREDCQGEMSDSNAVVQ